MNLIKDDDGAALLSVLLLVSVMSAALVAAFDMLGFYTKKSVSEQQRLQAQEYALAGELVGAEQAGKFGDLAQLSDVLGIDQSAYEVNFPVQNGTVNGKLIERSNCFNLASLVKPGNGNQYIVNEIAFEQYTKLLQSLGIGSREAMALSASLTDWQDSDGRPLALGAEDYVYSSLDVPYRTPNVPIADISELKIVNGYTAELIEAIKPFVCVDALTLETILNVNSIRSDQAVIMHALLPTTLTLEDIALLIRERPNGGYDHISYFWAHRFLKGREINPEIRGQFKLTSNRYEIQVDVKLSDVRSVLTSLISLNEDGSYQLISRKFGV